MIVHQYRVRNPADFAGKNLMAVGGGDGVTRVVPTDALLVFFGLSPKLGPIADWGLQTPSPSKHLLHGGVAVYQKMGACVGPEAIAVVIDADLGAGSYPAAFLQPDHIVSPRLDDQG